MKKFIFSLFGLLLFFNCSDDSMSRADLDDLDKESYRINLKAKVEPTVISKSGPINSNFSTDFPAGIYAYNLAWKSGATANLINNDNATVLGAAGHNINFAGGPYYYPTDGTLVNFFAYAPSGTETTPAGVGTSPTVNISMTGQEDIMWASATGSKVGSVLTPPVFNFQHKLTQLQFTFQSGANYPASGNSVVSLTVNSQPNAASMVVGTGAVTFGGSANMQALSTANQTAGIGITTAGTNANSPVMTQTALSYSLTIVVKPAGGGSNVTYSNVPVTLTTLAGSAHMITLTFSATGITATATVTDWATGTGGSVSVL